MTEQNDDSQSPVQAEIANALGLMDITLQFLLARAQKTGVLPAPMEAEDFAYHVGRIIDGIFRGLARAASDHIAGEEGEQSQP